MRFFAPLNPPMEDWRDKVVWIIGASTGIGRATVDALLSRGARVAVSARSADTLNALAAQHPKDKVIVLPFDVGDPNAVRAAHEQLTGHGPLDLVLCCAGHYHAQRATEFDRAEMLTHNQVNYVGAINVLDVVLPSMIARRSGHIALVASVAGFRGLPQSLAYGPTKAALTNMGEVLYTDLHALGIGISVVQPGFVETPLTAQNTFSMPALISPAQAAEAMLRGWADGAFEIHFPKRFTWWMKLMRVLPYRIYFPLVRRFTKL